MMSGSGMDCVDRSVDCWGGVVNGCGVGNGSVVDRSRLMVDRLVVTNDILGGYRRRVVWDTSLAYCYQRTSYHDLMNKQTLLKNELKRLNKHIWIFFCNVGNDECIF